MKAFRTLLCMALTLAIAGGAMADDEKKPAKKGEGKKPAAAKGEKGDKAATAKTRAEARKGKGRKAPSASTMFLRGIELTDEQKKAVAPIDAEFAAKLAESRKAQLGILTEDQRKAQQAAFAKVREAGKTATPEQRKALQKELQGAVKLSDEQKAKQSELRKAQGKLRTDYLAKVGSILTADQKAKLKGRGKRPGKGDAAGKKPGAKKPGAKKDGAAKKPAKKDAA
jgi:hypothetical protein